MSDEIRELIPPWEEFPNYERYTIGWRMGTGEDYLIEWRAFLEELPTEFETRLSYLRRHQPAPLSWGDWVLAVLDPDVELEQELGCSPKEIRGLLDLGLVAYDIAYSTWLRKHPGLEWPWSLTTCETPEKAVRYGAREFWFFSRQLEAMRRLGDLEIDEVPDAWKSVERQLSTRLLGEVTPEKGLLTLAQMLCAGTVQPPWELGLPLSDFANSFEMDMGYTDAFRLWIMSAFDDDRFLREMLTKTRIPSLWRHWIDDCSNFLWIA